MKIGVVLMLVEVEALQRALTFEELRRTAQNCEDLGFDSIWVYDHLIYQSGKSKIGIWEGWSMLSALAAITKKVELGTLVTCNSFRNPAILAKMAHTVDEISNGRLILGVGAGWNEPEYKAFGMPFDHRVTRFEEALQIIHPLLKKGHVDFQGNYYSARDCEIRPRSPRKDGIPLMIGGRKPRVMQLVAKYADLYNVCYTTIPRSTEIPLRSLRTACKKVDRDLATLPYTFLASMAIPDLLGWKQPKKRGVLTGTVEEIAQTMLEYEALGTNHLMFHLNPSSPQGYARLAESMTLYRKLSQQRKLSNG